MITYPEINPVAFSLGPIELPLIGLLHLQVHWYGLMYLFGFIGAWWLGKVRANVAGSGWTQAQVSDVIFYGALGVVLGGRIGYILFYNFDKFIDNPALIFRIWEGGMSFHGGMLGVFIALYLFARHQNKTFFQVSDFIAPMVPIGLGFGRMGNFINRELWGRPVESSVPWAMDYGDHIARHPSALYQAMTEGVLLFVILYLYSRKPRPTMAVSGVFMIGYGCFRFITEFFRTPDSQLGFVMFGWLTRGQELSIPMIVFGIGILVWAYKKNQTSKA